MTYKLTVVYHGERRTHVGVQPYGELLFIRFFKKPINAKAYAQDYVNTWGADPIQWKKLGENNWIGQSSTKRYSFRVAILETED